MFIVLSILLNKFFVTLSIYSKFAICLSELFWTFGLHFDIGRKI
jgi:hypothetical protein